jgi:putative tricarboxylic transport membrane protein
VRNKERCVAMTTSLGGAIIMVYAWHTLKLGSIHAPDAGFLPFLCGAGLAVLGVVWSLILRWTAAPEDGPAEERLWHRPVLSLALMAGYAWTIENLGYISSTLVFMVAWQQCIEREKWLRTAIISILGTLAMYALFVSFLKVPVPKELFFR